MTANSGADYIKLTCSHCAPRLQRLVSLFEGIAAVMEREKDGTNPVPGGD